MDNSNSASKRRKPEYLRVKAYQGRNYKYVRSILKKLGLSTVCESANCPNIFECFENKTATFLILGNICTRNCSFCSVQKGHPLPIDESESEKIAEAIDELNLTYAVITSVTRDDLKDGGANAFAATINAIRNKHPKCKIEVLIPDFNGNQNSLKKIIKASPDILSHNIETVPSLYQYIRPKANYFRSLSILKQAKELGFNGLTKSGIMVGIGESINELIQVFCDLKAHNCDILTVGQYLSPSKKHWPVKRYYKLEEFSSLKEIAINLGFSYVEAGPLVRSSYHAANQASQLFRLR